MCDFVCVCWLTHELCTHIRSVHTCETVNAHVYFSIPTRGGGGKDVGRETSLSENCRGNSKCHQR